MAIEFSRAYLSAAADVGRLLGSVGLELHAEQTAADEFDYSLSTAEVRLTSSDYVWIGGSLLRLQRRCA